MKQLLSRTVFSACLLLIVLAPLALAQKPVVTLSATSLSFATREAGTMSAAQVVTLTNTGNATLTITQLAAEAPTRFSTISAPR